MLICKMENNSKRGLTVLAVVVACFAVLWPKIFYPMITSIIFPQDSEEENLNAIRNLNYENLLPQMIEAMGESRPLDRSFKDANRVVFHPSVRYMSKPHSKGAGAINLFIPIYTIGIIIFFIYILLKTVLKSYPETTQSFTSSQQKKCLLKSAELEEIPKRKENTQERKAKHALEQYGKDKVLAALKTIILEMEDFKENFVENDTYRSISMLNDNLEDNN